MSVGPVGGYKGCNGSRALTDLYAYEPGTSLAGRHGHYAGLTAEAEGHHKPALLEEATTTDTKRMATTLKPADYKPPVRGGVQAGRLARLPMERRFVARSMAQSSFADYAKEAEEWSAASVEAIRGAFDVLDVDGSGSLEPREVRMAMMEVLQREPSDHEHRVFMAHLDTDKNGRISREEWERGVAGAVQHLAAEAEISVVHKDQPWKKRYPRERRVMSNLAMASSSMRDMGTRGSVPTDRPLLTAAKVLASTTNDLQEGTVKDTLHPPRYTGFVPQAQRTAAYAQSRVCAPRSTFDAKTNLTHTFSKRMPGFGGHVPSGKASLSISKRRGLFADTDKGVADSLVEQYWAARSSVAARRAAQRSGGS